MTEFEIIVKALLASGIQNVSLNDLSTDDFLLVSLHAKHTKGFATLFKTKDGQYLLIQNDTYNIKYNCEHVEANQIAQLIITHFNKW